MNQISNEDRLLCLNATVLGKRASQRDGEFGKPCTCLSDIQGQKLHSQKVNGQKSQDALVSLLQ